MTPSRLNVVVPARAESLSAVRERVADWLSSLGTPDERIGDIVLVVNEACSNSIEHAYIGGAAGAVRVSADVDSQSICFTVEDFGRWKTDTSKTDVSRGRGLALMRAMSSHVGLYTNTSGTRVSLSFPSPPVDRT
ncbi:MAG: rsbW 2 [Mycobacterium sp.]|jgi:anti-sigma regulatory factor (Ser/Thr protein kinase)|nr:rsbW 2 [Mycobacterium sp.]